MHVPLFETAGFGVFVGFLPTKKATVHRPLQVPVSSTGSNADSRTPPPSLQSVAVKRGARASQQFWANWDRGGCLRAPSGKRLGGHSLPGCRHADNPLAYAASAVVSTTSAAS
mmetsp:Transcript_14100/g.27855  ORF Transcript_14100/g.27855 Transcript_14100/m.27855 type:complete len:113 (-) Transcript_14100:1-339(-)